MDYFGVTVVVGLAVFGLALYLIGRYYPGSGAEVVDWRPTRSVETEVELELQDIDEMLEAQNARRRRRGEAELTEDQMRQRVADDLRESDDRRERYRAQDDLDELLEAANARRRARGEPELTADELRADGVGSDPRRPG